MQFKTVLLCTFMVVQQYMYATNAETQNSTYAQFVASYEQLFKEVPAEIWSKNRQSCSRCVQCNQDCNHCEGTA